MGVNKTCFEAPAELTSFLMNPILFPADRKPYVEKVEKWLSDPKLLEIISQVLSERIVGEELNRLTLFLVALSYKTDEPQGAIITAPPASGKSWLAYNVLRLFPNVINLSRITMAALDRLGTDLSHFILYVSELGGQEQATPTLRVMLSEGELRLATIDRESWQPTVIETKGTPVYITTTTQQIIEQQLASRTWLLNLDTTKEQTRRILEFQGKQAATSNPPDAYSEDEMVLRCLIYELKPYKVLVPYAEKLSALFPAEETQARRDFKRLLSMIKVITLLYQKQRALIESNGETYLVSSLSDLANALKLVKPILLPTLYSLPKKAFEVLHIFQEAGKQQPYTVKEIAHKVKLSQNRTRTIMNGLFNRGFLFKDESHRVHQYYWSGKTLEEPTILSTVISSTFFSQEEFEKWLISNRCIYSETPKELYKTYIAGALSERLERLQQKETKPVLTDLEQKKPKEITVVQTVAIPEASDMLNVQKPSTHTLTQENVEQVFKVLVEASRVRGAAHTSEVASMCNQPQENVEIMLKRLEREGKAVSVYPDWWKPVR